MHVKECDGKKYLFHTETDFKKDIPVLVKKIREIERTKMGGFNGILGIPRGGLPLATYLSHQLNLIMALGGATKNTIVVDDIADTGKTLAPYVDRESVIVTLFYHRQSIVIPHIWLHEKTPDIYQIVFDWETDPTK